MLVYNVPQGKIEYCKKCGGWGYYREQPSSEYPIHKCTVCQGSGKVEIKSTETDILKDPLKPR